VHLHDLVHPDGEREVVRRVLEQWVSTDVHFVEVDTREKLREPKRLLVRDEMDLVATRRERDTKLGRDGAGATVGRIAGNANLHVLPLPAHQSFTSSAADGSLGSMRVVTSGSS